MATHIENLEIESYRGIRALSIDKLGDVNIFVGDNNTGKTSVLEAVQILCAPNKNNLVQVARQRERVRNRMGLSFIDSMKYLFDMEFNQPEQYELKVKSTIHGEECSVYVSGHIETRLVDLDELQRNKQILSYMVNDGTEELENFCGFIGTTFDFFDADGKNMNSPEYFELNKYSKIKMNDARDRRILPSRTVLTTDHVMENAFNMLIKNSEVKDKAVKLLKEEFDDRIVDLRIISDSNSFRYIPVVEVENGAYMPLSLYGDGMKKALTMLNAIINTENGVCLIDEFETALHISAMKKVFSFVVEAARKSNVQLFLTTHSLEAVDELLGSVDGKDTHNIKIIRLKKKKGKTFSYVLDGQEAIKRRREYDMELRS